MVRRTTDDGIFRAIAGGVPDPMALVGPDDEFEYINSRFLDVFGYTLADIPDMDSWFERAYPDEAYRSMVRSLWERDRSTLAEGSVQTRVFTVRCLDGRDREIKFRITRSGGRFALFMEEITGPVRSARSRRAGEVMFRAIFERAGIAICVTDLHGRIVMVNEVMTDMLRCGDRWIIGKTIFDISHPDDVEPEKNLIREAMADKERPIYRIEKRYIRRDGTQLWARLTGTWVIDDRGRLLFGLGMAEEITGEKEVEEKLEESETRFMALVERTIVGVYIMQDGVFQYVNPALAAMLDYRPEELTGKIGPGDLVGPEDWPRVRDKIMKRMTGQIEAERYSTHFSRKGGDMLPVEVYGAWMTYRGRPALIGTILDMSERLQIQNEEKQRTERTILFQRTLLEIASVEQLPRNTACSAIAEETARTLDVDRVSVWLTGSGNSVSCENVYDRNGTAPAAVIPPDRDQFIKTFEAAAEAGVHAVDDVRGDSVMRAEGMLGADTGAFLDAAVRVHGHFAGILRCEFNGGRRHWLLEEMNFLSSMANILSLVLVYEERKQAMAALVESEERFTRMAESIRDGWTIVEHGRVVYVNSRLSEITGYPRERLMKMTGLDLAAPEERARLVAVYRDSVRNGAIPTDIEHWIVKSDGERRCVQNRYSPLVRDGNRVGWCMVTTDITERKIAERSLASEKERLAITLRSLNDGVIAVDASGMVTVMNRAAGSLVGREGSEAEGRPIGEIYRAVELPGQAIRMNPVDGILKGGEQFSREGGGLISHDGSERIVAESAAPLADADGIRIGAVLVFRDITDRVKMERELQKALKLESVGILAGGIAHDFNNILTALLGNISIARMLLTENDEIAGVLTGAEKAALRARDLTQQLLVFSRGGAPIKQCSAIENLVEDSASFVLLGSAVSCQWHFGQGNHNADIDRGQISQVIQNLVINARQAMPDGGVIDISVDNVDMEEGRIPQLEAGKYVRITVKDNGGGIPHENLQKVFDPYFTTKEKGNGLGLAISYRIIKQHGGHISAESQPGQGATFAIYLPSSGRKEATQGVEKSVTSGSGRVLVMDDEEMVRDIAGHMLKKLGYDTVMAADGNEALEFYRRYLDEGRPFDAVIMDLTVPGGMGGMETSARIHAIHAGAKIIVCSGYSNDPVMAEYRAHGFAGVLAKPFRFQDLARALDAVILKE